MKTQKRNMMPQEHHNPKIIIVKPINSNNIMTRRNINLILNRDIVRIISKLIGLIY